jgi:hypothetical protein
MVFSTKRRGSFKPTPDPVWVVNRRTAATRWHIPLMADTQFNKKCRDSLRYAIIQQVVKDAAVFFGFSPKNFGCQSLRSGGATLLRAVGASDSEIMMMGRWKSMTACLGYQEQSTNTHDRLLKVLLTEGAYSNRDLSLQFPKPICTITGTHLEPRNDSRD